MKIRIGGFSAGSITLAGLLVTGCVSTATHQDTLDELEGLRRQQAATAGQLEASRRKAAELQQALGLENKAKQELEEQIKKLKEAQEAQARENERQMAQVAAAAPATEVTAVQSEPGQFKITIVAHLLFESGDDQVTPSGREILRQVRDALKQVADKQIRVEGHTDNKPIKPYLRSRFPTNWELSTARASSVVRHLVAEDGLDPATLSAVGYGDTKPVASNKNEDGRRQNRRIEIVLYPKAVVEPASAPKKE
jgi:chemotaxis protein MotB